MRRAFRFRHCRPDWPRSSRRRQRDPIVSRKRVTCDCFVGACHRACVRATRWLAMTRGNISIHMSNSNEDTRPRPRGTKCPSFASCLALSQTRGRRECRMLAAPASLACRKLCTLRTQETTGQPKQPASPAQWFTAYSVLSSVSRASCHRRLRASSPAKLDPSIAGSGPHAFAVRDIRRSSYRRHRVHRIPPHVRDVRNAPLIG